VGFSYAVDKDSAGNFLFTMKYDKIQVHTKTEDTETDLDADNATLTLDPVEKMLGILKTANIVAIVTPAGEIKTVTGYKELTARIMENFGNADAYTKITAQAQWEQFVQKGVIQKGMDQLFKIFPDSAVHVGDKWKTGSSESEELGLKAKSFFTLKEINNGIARITASGDIASDSSTVNVMGQMVNASLKGRQQGGYEMDTKSGMLTKSSISAKVKGTIQMMGREIPVNIETSVTINGKQIK
jgi:hypothetical protein